MEEQLLNAIVRGQRVITINNIEFTLPYVQGDSDKKRTEFARKKAKELIKTLNS